MNTLSPPLFRMVLPSAPSPPYSAWFWRQLPPPLVPHGAGVSPRTLPLCSECPPPSLPPPPSSVVDVGGIKTPHNPTSAWRCHQEPGWSWHRPPPPLLFRLVALPFRFVPSKQGEGGRPKCLHASGEFKALQQLTQGVGTCLDKCGTGNGLGEGGREGSRGKEVESS